MMSTPGCINPSAPSSEDLAKWPDLPLTHPMWSLSFAVAWSKGFPGSRYSFEDYTNARRWIRELSIIYWCIATHTDWIPEYPATRYLKLLEEEGLFKPPVFIQGGFRGRLNKRLHKILMRVRRLVCYKPEKLSPKFYPVVRWYGILSDGETDSAFIGNAIYVNYTSEAVGCMGGTHALFTKAYKLRHAIVRFQAKGLT